MTFFALTAAIMAVSILLIYKLCCYFGLELKWISLVLCAIFALGVNGATIILSPFLTQAHYLRLVALVLVSAALVTIINEYLLKREHHQVVTADGEVLTLAEDTEGAAEQPVEKTGQEVLLAAADETAGPAASPAGPEPTAEEKAETGAKAEERLSQRLLEAINEDNRTGEAAERGSSPETAFAGEIQADAAQEEAPAQTEAEVSPGADVEENIIEDIVEAALQDDAADAGRAPEPFPSVPEASPAEETAAEEPESAPADVDAPTEITETASVKEEQQPEGEDSETAPAQESEEPAEEEAPADEFEAAEQAVAELSSLDEILDYAYSHKENEPNAAIIAYRAAIDRYPEDSYAPFLIIELAGLYKERASYSEAINLYAESLGMPIIAGDDAMVQEFSKTLRYLGTVQDILSRHHALATPFSKLTPEILKEIEDEFAKRQAK